MTHCDSSLLYTIVLITSQHGPHQKHRSQEYPACLLLLYLEMDVVYCLLRVRWNVFTNPLPSNEWVYTSQHYLPTYVLVFVVVSFLLAFSPIPYIYSSSPHSYYTPSPSHPPWLDHSNYTWGRVQVIKLLIMQFSPTSCHFVSFRSKYSPQHSVLKHPHSVFLP
jgi:hypothetical protein